MFTLLDPHVHTVASGHAYSTLKDYIEQAKEINLKAFAITEHGYKMPGSCGEIYFRNLKTLPKFVDDIRIYKGIELNILDTEGTVDLADRFLARLEVVIASLHTACIPQGTVDENTMAIINTMKNPNIKIIGHPGDVLYPINIEKVVKAASDMGKVLEINNASLKPESHRKDVNSIKEIIRLCKEYNVPMTLGSDAHFYKHLGDFTFAIELLEEFNISDDLILNTNIELFERILEIK